MRVELPPEWSGPSDDPADEQFGDVVEATTLESDANYEALLVGEPYDDAVVGRQGAAEGPAAIRAALASLKTHQFDSGPVTSVGDLGDCIVEDSTVKAAQNAYREHARDVHAKPGLPVFLGGDNSLSYPNAVGLLERGTLGIVNLDAHLDCRTLERGPSSGTPYRQLFEAGLDALAVLGARSFETSQRYHDYLREQDGEIVTAEEVGADPVAAADVALGALAGVDSVYVSLDLDVLDAAHAPGVSAPTPGGLTARELFVLLRLLAADGRLAGFEVVECAPPLDSSGRTAQIGARAIAHVLAAHQVSTNE